MASLSIIAKMCLPDKMESKPTSLQSEYKNEKRISCSVGRLSSSIDSSSSCPYSSTPESKNSTKCGSNENYYNDLNDIINGVQRMKILSIHNGNKPTSNDLEYPKSHADEDSNTTYKRNIVVSNDEKSEPLSDEENDHEDKDDVDDGSGDDDDDEGLIERGPVRPQLHPMSRAKPYIESSHHWASPSIVQHAENSTDYDTSAKAIMTDREYREKIDFCLNKLSDMSQARSMTNSLSPAHSDFGGVFGYSVSVRGFFFPLYAF